jgi:hypothetical protein
MTQYFVLVDINSNTDKAVWTLTREQLDAITRLLIDKGDFEAISLGTSIDRAVRAVSGKVSA